MLCDRRHWTAGTRVGTRGMVSPFTTSYELNCRTTSSRHRPPDSAHLRYVMDFNLRGSSKTSTQRLVCRYRQIHSSLVVSCFMLVIGYDSPFETLTSILIPGSSLPDTLAPTWLPTRSTLSRGTVTCINSCACLWNRKWCISGTHGIQLHWIRATSNHLNWILLWALWYCFLGCVRVRMWIPDGNLYTLY